MSFKLSKESVDILTNLASIDPSMVLMEGNKQATSNRTARIYATAVLPDEVDDTFAMYNITDLLGKFQLFKNDFSLKYDDENKTVTIYDEHSSVVVHTSDMNIIDAPKVDITIGEDEHDIVFDIDNKTLNKMNEFMRINDTNVVSFTKRDDDPFIRIEGYDYDILKEGILKGLEVRPTWFIRIGSEVDLESFSYYTRINFKMYDTDYTVRIRQFLGVRGTPQDKQLNSTRAPVIQFDSDKIRYAVTYQQFSKNQESLRNV